MHLFYRKRDNVVRQNPAPRCNMEKERGKARNMHVLVDANLAMGVGKGNTM